MSERILHLYHGTDLKCAESIRTNGFVPRYSSEHWLGNGIYFFEDRALAEWWTTRMLPYMETQICAFTNDVIRNIEYSMM